MLSQFRAPANCRGEK